MKYSLSVSFEVQLAAAYKALSKQGRSEARAQFYAVVQQLLPLMNTAETADPAALLASQLGKAAGQWGMDSGASLATTYHYDPVTGRWVCSTRGALLLDGAAVAASVNIEGVDLKASYSIGWSHEGPVQAL